MYTSLLPPSLICEIIGKSYFESKKNNEIVNAFEIQGSSLGISSGITKESFLWKTKTTKLIKTFKGHSDEINGVCISNNSEIIVTGSYDKTAKLHNV